MRLFFRSRVRCRHDTSSLPFFARLGAVVRGTVAILRAFQPTDCDVYHRSRRPPRDAHRTSAVVSYVAIRDIVAWLTPYVRARSARHIAALPCTLLTPRSCRSPSFSPSSLRPSLPRGGGSGRISGGGDAHLQPYRYDFACGDCRGAIGFCHCFRPTSGWPPTSVQPVSLRVLAASRLQPRYRGLADAIGPSLRVEPDRQALPGGEFEQSKDRMTMSRKKHDIRSVAAAAKLAHGLLGEDDAKPVSETRADWIEVLADTPAPDSRRHLQPRGRKSGVRAHRERRVAAENIP